MQIKYHATRRQIVLGPDIVWTEQPSKYVFINKVGDNQWNVLCAGSIFLFNCLHARETFIERYTHDQMLHLIEFFKEHGNEYNLNVEKFDSFVSSIGRAALYLDVIDDVGGRKRFYDNAVFEWKIKCAKAFLKKIFFHRASIGRIVKSSIRSLQCY